MSYLYNTQPAIEERLETEHLLLRPYQPGDEGDFMRLITQNKNILAPAFGVRQVKVRTMEDARNTVEQLRADWDNRRVFDFGVWLKEQNQYIGNIALKNLDHRIPKAELGFYFADWPTTQEQARQAIGIVVNFAFNTLVLNKLYIRCTKANDYLGKFSVRCGFVKEGTLRSDYKNTGSEELVDLNYYGMTRQDFEKKQKPEEIYREVAFI